MPQFNAVLDLSTLDGVNGFRLDGIDANDASGASVASAGDVNGDGFDDMIVGASGGDPGGDDLAGESYVVFGKAGGFTSAFNLSTLDGNNGFRLDGIDAVDLSGFSVASAGDVNGDGFGDLIVGARNADPAGDDGAGESYVVFGKASGFTGSIDLGSLDGDDGFRLDGIDALDFSGRSVASAGDVNGDGFGDIVIGAYRGDPGGDQDAGESYVVFGKASGFDAAIDLSTLDGNTGFRLDGIDAGDQSGSSVASAGDVNGDGFADIIVGARYGDPDGLSEAGETYVVFGKASGFPAALDLASLDGANGFRLDGVDAGDNSGLKVASAGDVNGDGLDDLIVGAGRASQGGNPDAGESYVVFGRVSGFPAALDLASLNGANGFRLEGIDGGDFSGASVASAGDINGDGFDDIIVGAFDADPGGGPSAGESYVVFGKASGFSASIDFTNLDGNNGFRLDGIVSGETSGTSVASAGDVNADGFDDIVIGAPFADPGGDGSAGESYVVFGHRALDAVTITGTDRGLVHNGGFGDDTINAFGGDDTARGFEGDDTISGGDGADTLDGGTGDDTITGGGGNDLISDGEGNDTVNAGAGRDILGVTSGADFINGGADRDLFDFRFLNGPIAIDLSSNTLAHPNGQDVVTFSNIEDVRGSSGNDTVVGNSAANYLIGLGGNDSLDGRAGADLIEGGLGADTMTGGTSGDRFIFRSILESGTSDATRDIITDFTVNPAAGNSVIDRIDLNAIDAQAGLAGNQSFAFIGNAAFTAEGQVRAIQSGAHTIVEVNTTGVGVADMTIQLSNFTAANLTSADFIL